MPNSRLSVLRNVTAGGRPSLPFSWVRVELFQIEVMSKALTARTRAR